MKNLRISYFIDVIFKITKTYYNKYIKEISSPTKKNKIIQKEHYDKLEIFKDIINDFLVHKELDKLFDSKFYNDFKEINNEDINDLYFELEDDFTFTE